MTADVRYFKQSGKSRQSLNFLLGHPHSNLFLLVSLTLVGFASVDIQYLGLIFTNSVRWLLLVLLLIYVFWRNLIISSFRGWIGLFSALNVAWPIVTILWSQVPQLTMMKSMAFAVVAPTFLSAGYAYARASVSQSTLRIFAPMMLLAIIAGAFGATQPIAVLNTGSVSLYRGLVNNPNLLGLLLIMSMPWALWIVYASRFGSHASRLYAYCLLGVLLTTLVASGARSSMLSVGVVGIFFLFAAGMRRYGMLLLFIVLGGFFMIAFVPDTFDHIEGIVLKGQQASGDLFYSRRLVWEESLEGARQGGLLGVGYGVSAGDTSFAGGYTAVGYGREKGNSALAVLEELGQIGFMLYGGLLAAIGARLISALRVTFERGLRVQLGLVLGTLLALSINSQFEAWWVAPGAPASPYFWALTGVGMALSTKAFLIAAERKRAMMLAHSVS